MSFEDKDANIVQIDPDDGGPVDAEHVRAVAMLDEGLPPEDLAEMLRNCTRPAKVTFLHGRPN